MRFQDPDESTVLTIVLAPVDGASELIATARTDVEDAEEAPVHRRDAGEERDLLGLHQAEGRLGLEARQHHDGAAVREATVLDDGLAKGMEQRKHTQIGVGLVVRRGKQLFVHLDVVDQVAVHQLGALGLAGRAGCIQDRARVLGL